ncbi:hypothetical protein HPO96_03820 [Kribbella sandramycini]|uniref:WD40 repeat protein n=1 Tax=Kribbella sandramycini TaxID=60450 RepID=A0A7Y4KVE2_9ACTN|nr:hypothetical protein [Kribbella sandramycini]MBB6568039.1 hypothetical protein [Kribbella sandramycini]NOL39367.1 hypothetical protein [Kribbella sandramycini]
MNDTESRLRDYLDTKAASVPPTAHGPGLDAELTRRRAAWPAVLAAAAVAVVLALTITFITSDPDKPAPAASPAADGPPQVPYVVTEDTDIPNMGPSTLYDGTRTVRLPEDVRVTGPRMGDGWLAWTRTGRNFRVGILGASGKVRQLGPSRADMPVASPDRKQIAIAHRPNRNETGDRLVVLDAGTGAEDLNIAMPRKLSLVTGWNRAGIWVMSDISGKVELFVLRAGEQTFRPVAVGGLTASFATSPQSDTVVYTTSSAGKKCLHAAELRNGKLDVLRTHCEQGVERAVYPVGSRDGRTMVFSERKLAIDVASGKTTQLRLPEPIESYPTPVFEDETKLLVVTQQWDSKKKSPQRLYRCDVTTGDCKLLRTEKDDTQIKLLQP